MARVKAEVQNFHTRTVGDLRTNARAALPCQCAIYVGLRHPQKVGTVAQPCSPEHELITDRSSGLLRERQKTPRTGKLLVEVCAEVLTQAAKEMG